MKLTLNIPDHDSDKALPLIAYLKSLDFITIEQEEDFVVPEWHKEIVRERVETPSLSKDLKKAVDELNLIKQGKLKGIPAKQLLDEL